MRQGLFSIMMPAQSIARKHTTKNLIYNQSSKRPAAQRHSVPSPDMRHARGV